MGWQDRMAFSRKLYTQRVSVYFGASELLI